MKNPLNTLLDNQYPHPKGLIGRVAGEVMVRQHKIETTWTVSLADVQPTDHVLEIGFGAGKAIEPLAQKTTHGQVYGIDLSSTMVEQARRRNAQALASGQVTLLQSDASHLSFDSAQFDKVISIHTFYFWSDPFVVLTEIFRVLKPGGKLIFTISTGRAGETALLKIIEEQILPQMRTIGFINVSSIQGPPSRQFNILAVLGTKL